MSLKISVQTFLLLFTLTFASCQSKKLYQASNLPATYLEFGTYNINSGVAVTWIILENGQVFYKNNLFVTEQKRLSKVTTSSLFAEAKRVKRSGYKIRVEGAYMAHITLKSSVQDTEFTWSWPYGGSKEYPDELKALYIQIEYALNLTSNYYSPSLKE
jgi:hypothetical protein